MKKILLILTIIIFIFFIYNFTKDTKDYIFIFGDEGCHNSKLNNSIKMVKGNNLEKYINVCQNNVNINDYINKIDHNTKIKYHNKEYRFNNLLIKADMIIISIGMNDLLEYNDNTNMYTHIDEVLKDMDILLSMVRYYSKEKIYIYNYYGMNRKYLDYANSRLKEIANQYDIDIIDINIIKNNRLSQQDYDFIIKQTLKKLKKNS